MKKMMMQRVMATMTALMAGIAMTASLHAWAVDSPTIDAPPAHKLPTSSVQADIPINKDIVLFNPEELYIHEPNIIYTYDIMPADVTNAEIVTKSADSEAMTHLAVRPGILEAIIAIKDGGLKDENGVAGVDVMTKGDGKNTGTITFGLDNKTKKMTNPEATPPVKVTADYKYRKNMAITVDASKIYMPTGATTPNSPGVYRYKIMDVTTVATFEQSGVTDGGASNTVYLDVYVKNNADSTGFEIYGYVLLRETTEADNVSITHTEEEIPETVKIEGFVSEDEGEDPKTPGTILPAYLKVDSYHTYNVHITKQVAGDLADRNHKFPVKIELTNETIKNQADFSVNDGHTHTDNHLSAAGEWDSETNKPDGIEFLFKNGEAFNIIGLPVGTKVKVTETNDTKDIYSVSVQDSNGSSLDLKKEGSDTVSKSVSVDEGEKAEMNAAFLIKTLTENGDQIVVTNTLRDISVTGLLFDIAPFIFITATGIILLALYMNGKRKNDAEPKI